MIMELLERIITPNTLPPYSDRVFDMLHCRILCFLLRRQDFLMLGVEDLADGFAFRARLINLRAPWVAGLERFLAFQRLSIAGYVIEPKAEKRPSQRRHLVISTRASQLDMS